MSAVRALHGRRKFASMCVHESGSALLQHHIFHCRPWFGDQTTPETNDFRFWDPTWLRLERFVARGATRVARAAKPLSVDAPQRSRRPLRWSTRRLGDCPTTSRYRVCSGMLNLSSADRTDSHIYDGRARHAPRTCTLIARMDKAQLQDATRTYMR